MERKPNGKRSVLLDKSRSDCGSGGSAKLGEVKQWAILKEDKTLHTHDDGCIMLFKTRDEARSYSRFYNNSKVIRVQISIVPNVGK